MNNVEFESADFDNYKGSYKNILIVTMNRTVKIRNNYGIKKGQSAYDEQGIDKF